MKDFPVIKALVIAIVPALIAAANNWILKLYEIRRAREIPKIIPNDKRAKHEKKAAKWSLFIFIINCALIANSLYKVVMRIADPSEYPNFDALDISISVITMAFCSYAIIVRKTEREFMRVWGDHASMTDAHSESLNKIIDIISVLAKKIEKLEKHKRKR
jgi:Na+/phosphate symporter